MDLKNYEFKTDWYFFAGDNVLNSRDSRYFGLVPEEYIIGIVSD
jgi:signal peptidase I